jgi:hypothetical protein
MDETEAEYECIEDCTTGVTCSGCNSGTRLGDTVYMRISPDVAYFHKGCLPSQRKVVRVEPGKMLK